LKVIERGKAMIKVEEAAKMLEVSQKTIYNYIKHKQIKAVKIGRRLLIDDEEMESFLKKGTERNYLNI